MKRVAIRVEPFSTYLERRRKGPIFPVILAGETVYVSGLPPFDPDTGEIKRLPFTRQAEIVLDQMARCLKSAGSSLERVVKCNVYCTPEEAHFVAFNVRSTPGIFPWTPRPASFCMFRRGRVRSISK